MPRLTRADAGQQSSASVLDHDCDWLEADNVESMLRKLCGSWRDQMGSTYQLKLDKEGTVELRTTRPRGKTMRTRGLIRIEWQDEYGRIVWGRPGARTVFTIGKLNDTSLMWQSDNSKPFLWDRVEVWGDCEEPEAEAAGPSDSHWVEDRWLDDSWAEGEWNEEAWGEEAWGEDEWAESTSWYGAKASHEDALGTQPWREEAEEEGQRQPGEQKRAGRSRGAKKGGGRPTAAAKVVSILRRPDGAEGDQAGQLAAAQRRLSDAEATTEALRSLLGISSRRDGEQADAASEITG